MTREKSRLEEAQRAMRKEESHLGRDFGSLLFKRADLSHVYPRFESLAVGIGWVLEEQKTKGVWESDKAKARAMKRPFRGDLTNSPSETDQDQSSTPIQN